MTSETDKLADKVVNDLVEGDLVYWAKKPEILRSVRKSLHADEEHFRRLNEESYKREK